ncbi:MAG: hypothetical protein K2M76_03995, partial [Muribaculaceae bacterium]|nr:hypothetical protein [Muribaculaceae bacterium]
MEILPECNYKHRKNLSAGTYRFVTHHEPGFFGQNISLQAIVGMNGAGKSTLLDMIIRMVNNFGALIFAHLQEGDCDYRYVGGVYAILNYMIDDRQGSLVCRGDKLCLKFDNEELRCDIASGIEYYVNGLLKKVEKKIIHDMASNFFYTVVGNYSLQSFISSDYRAEKSFRFNRKLGRWVVDNSSIWLDSVFHKNDGYMMPVTLNPFRDNGTIDMYNESELAQYRITSLLIEFDRLQVEYPVGYRLSNIEYKYDWRKLVGKFIKRTRGESYKGKYRELLDKIRDNCLSSESNHTFCDVIFESFNINDFSTDDDEMLWMARLYLVSKIISIGNTYPSYGVYRYLC